MTVIQLMTTDQLLTATLQPKVSAGAVNTVQLQVDFCAQWEGFAKSAVFHTNKSTKRYEKILDSECKCIVPAEVLKEECILYIGIRGQKDADVKTTTLLKYKVVAGAKAGASTEIAPTPTIYQQLLTNYAEAMEAVSGVVETVETTLAEAQEEVVAALANTMPKTGGEFTGNTVAASVAGNQSGIRNMTFFDNAGTAITDNISIIKCYDK